MTKSVRFMLQMAVIGLGALLVLRGELTPGGMIASSILLARALAPLDQAMGAWRNFSAARFGYSRLKARLNAMPAEAERTRLPDPTGQLTVDSLTYTPPGTRRPVLHNIGFQVSPGQAVAVIGPSASGKSTLCRLLLGLYTPNGGQVRLDGSAIAHWEPEQLGRFIGYLPQDVELFAGTVRENIARMVDSDDDDAVIAAAQLAHAHDMIQHLPDGYDTQIGDGGTRLSAGQRQRVGLARAVFGDPKLVILDEPNSNLDQSGESALAAAIKELKERGAAVIIVGHRPSTLAQVDLILLLKEGRVNAFGPRDEVLQKLREAAAANVNPSGPANRPAAEEAKPKRQAGGEAAQ
jgi:ATP-binding cassette subfamily C protein/ATP-binding cassette subfamily C exporter for protease/lipase/ATP-binding cassette subfamily C protein EexD